MNKILLFIKCFILRDHNWTCAADEGKPATAAQLAAGLAGFKDYATMYCKDCNKHSHLNERL